MKWVKISENEKMTLYVDVESIVKSGEVFEYVELIDYRFLESVHPNNKSLSSLLHSIINCETNEQSILGVRDYSGHMGTGEILNEGYLKDTLRLIPPESLSYITLQFLKDFKEH